MRAILLFFLLLFTLSRAEAIQADTLLNHKAGPVSFKYALGKNVTPGFYHNKILVLDFWATWCAPCIAGFPHFNGLSKKYSSNDVVFAAISSNESLSIVQRFFGRTKKELNAVKLVDTMNTTKKMYHVDDFPYCVIIGKDNMVKWTGNTQDLNDEIMDQIIHNDNIYAPNGKSEPVTQPVYKAIADRAFFSFNVAKSDTGAAGAGVVNDILRYPSNIIELTSKNRTLAGNMAEISGLAKSRFITNSEDKLKQKIDLDYKLGADTLRYKNYENLIFKNSPTLNFTLYTLGNALKFKTKVITQKQAHLELIITDTTKLNSFKSMNTNHISFSDDYPPRFDIVGYNLKDVTNHLENSMNMIITTQITGSELYDLSLDISNVESLNKSLKFHGLAVITVNNEVQLLDINFY